MTSSNSSKPAVRIFKADIAGATHWPLPDGARLSRHRIEKLGIENKQPILLDDQLRPSGLLAEYIRERNLDLEPETASQYAYELRKLGEFLETRETTFSRMTSQDLRAYNKLRTKQAAKPIGPSAWKRNASAVRGFLDWMQVNGIRQDNPGVSVFRRSSLSGQPVPDEKIRALTREQWTLFLQHGIRGFATDLTEIRGRRGQNVGRLNLGAGIALTSGMRLQEFSTLLLCEVQQESATIPKAVDLEACAKYGKFRTVYLTPRVLRQADLYCRTERAYYAERKRRQYEANHRSYFVVESFDNGYAVGVKHGIRRRVAVKAIGPEERAKTIFEGPAGLESACLFVSRTGALLDPRSWHLDFRTASVRARQARLADGSLAFSSNVKPHDLRHTFAVQILRQLIQDIRAKGLQHSANLHDHLALNPVLTVQRLLGHSQPATTQKYLRYIETLDSPLVDAWEGWEDPSFTFEDYGRMVLMRSQEDA